MADKSFRETFDCIWKKKGEFFEIIKFLVDGGLDVNSLNKDGKTMLSYAAEVGNLEIVEFLVQKGADGSVANSDGSKPLHIAAKYGRTDIVEYFLNTSISADSCDNEERTPLHYVAQYGSQSVNSPDDKASCQDILNFLMDNNADLNAVDRKGRTPVVLAALFHRRHLVELLIILGANLEICDEDGYTVLHLAASYGWSETVLFIAEGRFGFDLDARLSSGETPLLLAACKPHKKNMVHLLIKLGADVGLCCEKGWTLLHRSCEHGWLDVVKYIVNTGCDLNGKNSDGCTPLVLAAEKDRYGVAEYLIQYGSNLDLESCDNEEGMTVLHYACKNNWTAIVESLIEEGSNVDAQSYSGDTPLHCVAHWNGNWDILELLLEAGADPNLKDNFGDTGFKYYIPYSQVIGLKMFIENGAFVQSSAYRSSYNLIEDPFIIQHVLQNVNLCTQSLINKYDYISYKYYSALDRIYQLPLIATMLPPIDKFEIASTQNQIQDIAKNVEHEIQTKGYCDLLKESPMALSMLCVISFAEYIDNQT